MKLTHSIVAPVALAFLISPFGCGDDTTGGGGDGAGPTGTGESCTDASECYPGVVPSQIEGTVTCLDRVRGGYCTHTCNDDTNCCAADKECETGIKEVCSPFESAPMNMCFISCEEGDLVPGEGQMGLVDPQEYCQREAGRDFICRSSGGGADNRKVCVPGDCGPGAACSSATDCVAGLDCEITAQGGYCTKRGCLTNAECPMGSLCANHVDGNSYCLKSCEVNTDCTLCRGSGDTSTCTADVIFLEQGTAGTVCVP